MRQQKPDLPITEVTKELAARWNTFDAAGKKKYEDIAAKDKERYLKEKEAYDIAKKAAKEKSEAKTGKAADAKNQQKQAEADKPRAKSAKRAADAEGVKKSAVADKKAPVTVDDQKKPKQPAPKATDQKTKK